MEAGKRNINDIFSGTMRLEIPFFQRSYVWGKQEWERFLEDIEATCLSGEPYFMGSLILKQKATSTEIKVGNVRMVVDGQQRLTTLSILMKVLSLKKGETKKFDRRFILVDDKPAMLHNHNDEAAYNRIMMLDSLVELKEEDNVTEAYTYFRSHADADKLDFDSICNLIYFVGIDLNYDEDEQQIFDTINSLGVRLTTAELLKNYFFGRKDIEAYKNNWLDIFEKDDETRNYWDRTVTTGRMKRTLIDLFFYAFLQIKVQDSTYSVTSDDKKSYAKVDKLFESYKAFIKKYADGDKTAILQEIREYATVFHRCISDKILQEDLQADAGVDRLNLIMFGLDTATLLPYVLYIEKNVVDPAVKGDLYAYLEAYIMRRMVTRKSTKNYNHLFAEKLIANTALSKDALKRALVDEDDLTNRMPSDEEIRGAFHREELINKYAAGVLYMIESKVRHRSKQATTLLGFKKYSLEHMMPKKWTNCWMPKGMSEEERKARDHTLLTLGNLTIITQALNASIRDADWKTKREGKGNKGGLKAYSTGIETVSKYLDYDSWNEEKIYERAEYLADKAINIWRQ